MRGFPFDNEAGALVGTLAATARRSVCCPHELFHSEKQKNLCEIIKVEMEVFPARCRGQVNIMKHLSGAVLFVLNVLCSSNGGLFYSETLFHGADRVASSDE